MRSRVCAACVCVRGRYVVNHADQLWPVSRHARREGKRSVLHWWVGLGGEGGGRLAVYMLYVHSCHMMSCTQLPPITISFQERS